MKLKKLHIENLRSFVDVKMEFNKYSILVGPNGAGKSTVLCALNILFREGSGSPTSVTELQEEDFHNRDTSKPIRITATFSDLSDKAQEDFSDYYRHGELTIRSVAKFNDATRKAEVKQYGVRLGIQDFAPFFQADGNKAKVGDLKSIYESIQKTYSELPPPGTKDSMKSALHAYEAAHAGDCQAMESEDQFYGVSKGINRLERHIQWVYVPAVKDAATEQIEARNSALGKLLNRAVKARTTMNERVSDLRNEIRQKYQELLDENKGALDDISSALRRRLAEWAHPDASVRLKWHNDSEKSVKIEDPLAQIVAGEHGFEGELSRFGHGMQRSYLLALLHELASYEDADAPLLLLGCEEPELYQHPPQARYLATVLQKLSIGNSQILITTHSPLFVSGATFEDVRLVRRLSASGESTVSATTFSELANEYNRKTGEVLGAPAGAMAKLHQILLPNINEMFFSQYVLFVEGIEDAAYINSYLALTERMDEFRRAGIHIIPVNKKSEMIRPYLVAAAMKIPVFIMFDADADSEEKHKPSHVRDNRLLLAISENQTVDPWPDETFWSSNTIMWRYQIGKSLEADITNREAWKAAKEAAEKEYAHVGGLDKNVLAIGARLSAAWDAGEKFPLLEKVISAVLADAKRIEAAV
ncbi:AAA family ATPase [Ferrovibrio terrae]|uniref:AAA family ATPase n=1 Tax=Ferrovibrio terrae TaxID=2594003 RepID=UPI0031383A65